MRKRLRATFAIATAVLFSTPAAARADVVRQWNAIAISVPAGNPFNQARVMAATQLAVFEAVNAIQGGYEPYLGTVVAPAGASADAAVIAAAHSVLKHYVPGAAMTCSAPTRSRRSRTAREGRRDHGRRGGRRRDHRWHGRTMSPRFPSSTCRRRPIPASGS